MMQANFLSRLQYVTMCCDKGGSRKRKSDDAENAERVKRSRLRQARTGVKSRVVQIGHEILKKKTEYLLSCPFVTLIIDEGNNWSKNSLGGRNYV